MEGMEKLELLIQVILKINLMPKNTSRLEVSITKKKLSASIANFIITALYLNKLHRGMCSTIFSDKIFFSSCGDLQTGSIRLQEITATFIDER
jgi:hypothetical protein